MSKVLFIHHSGILGGAGQSLVNAVRAAAARHEVTVYVSSDPDDMLQLLREAAKDNPVTVKTYGRRIGALTCYSGGDSCLSLRFWYRALLIFRQRGYFNRLISGEDPDTVVCNSKILCWMGALRSLRQRRSICFVRETMRGGRSRLINRVIARYLDRFDKVVFLSDYDRRRERLRHAQTEVICNYISPEQFDLTVSRDAARQRLGVSPDAFCALYVGGVSAMKGFDLVLRAVLSLPDNSVLLAAGNSFEEAGVSRDDRQVAYAREWQRYLAENDADGAVHMLGRQKDLSLCYAACDVLVFPMRSPHQSRPAFEAGLFGKPVIITDAENIREFVRGGDNGLTFPNGDWQALAAQLRRLKDDPSYAARLGESNRRNTQTKHNRERSSARIRALLEE